MTDPVYSQVGLGLTDSFLYVGQDPLRTPVTGKVQSNFTILLSKDGVGNQSVTGISITEVSASNNPGEYSVQIIGTAFPAVAGHYFLRIYDTTNTQFIWSWSYWITTSGGGNGTIGPALFTATAGNGRVTNGTSPIAGAGVSVYNGAVLYSYATTDINGLWGSVNFPAGTATYTVYVNVNGYAQGTSAITTSGSVAMGPGADIALTSATLSTGFAAQDLWAYAARMARNAVGLQANIEIPQAVTDALEQLATSHHWNWYRRYAQFQVHGAIVNTGTLSITTGSTTATFTGVTLPAWSNYTDDVGVVKLLLNNQTIKVISTNVGAGTCVIEAPWMEASLTGATYVLYCDTYSLPTNMYRFGSILPGQRWGYGPKPAGMDQIDSFQNIATYGQKVPDMFGILQGQLVMSSYPAYDILVRYSYFARPANLINPTDIVDWDPAHLGILHRAIDCQIAILYGGYQGGTYEQAMAIYMKTLETVLTNDKSQIDEASVFGNPMDLGTQRWKQRGS